MNRNKLFELFYAYKILTKYKKIFLYLIIYKLYMKVTYNFLN